jgi:RNA polymerase sigma-32 factor
MKSKQEPTLLDPEIVAASESGAEDMDSPHAESLDPDIDPEIELDEELDQPLDPEIEMDDAQTAPEKPQHLPQVYVPPPGREIAHDPLRLYLKEIGRFPLLKPDEEFDLSRRVQESNDQDAAFRLVSSHLRLVVKIAMDFQRRWMQNVLDLIQEGNVGLMRAVQKFDPDKGIKFSYYASFWIKAYILKFIMDNWRLVKIGTTQAQRKLFYNLNKERQRLESLGFDTDAAAISQALNVSESQVQEMEQRMGGNDLSLDITLGDDTSTTRLDILPALQPGIEETLAREEISRAMQEHIESIIPELSDKEVDILEKRLLADQPATLREIGEKYDITRERVRQLETRLLQKLKSHLTKKIGDFSQDWILKDD